MKRIFFLAFATAIIYFGCAKKNAQPLTTTPNSTQNANPKTLVANAGLDTTICMPYDGTGNLFKGILNGRASHDDSGKIVLYSWSEIVEGNYPNYVFSHDDSTVRIISSGIHTFNLQVRDDHGQFDNDTVIITINQNFYYEYDGLSWDSTVGGLTTISEKFKPGLIESWPDFSAAEIDKSDAYLYNYNGECFDINNSKTLPYIPYDSIQLTDKLVFYTLIFAPDQGILYPEIFAKTNSGINFNQKVSIGFDNRGPWDY